MRDRIMLVGMARPLPDTLGAVFSARSAREQGVTRARLGGEDLDRPFHGLYRRLDRDTGTAHRTETAEHPAAVWRARQLDRARTLARVLPSGYFFSGRTAAVILRLPAPVPVAYDDEVEVACFSPLRALRMRGVRGTRIDPRYARLVVHDGLPVSDAISTWCMLAPRLARRDGIALGDSVIRQHRMPGTRRLICAPHASLRQLELAAGVPRRRGGSLLLSLLPELSPHSASAPETHLRLLLAEWGAPTPRLDYDVFDPDGRLLGCSEIAFPEFRLAHEYEGDHHRVETAQWNRDIRKYSDYQRAGWEVIRVTAELLYRRPFDLRAQTLDLLTSRGWTPET